MPEGKSNQGEYKPREKDPKDESYSQFMWCETCDLGCNEEEIS